MSEILLQIKFSFRTQPYKFNMQLHFNMVLDKNGIQIVIVCAYLYSTFSENSSALYIL